MIDEEAGYCEGGVRKAVVSGEAGAPAQRVVALLMEGVLNPNDR